MQDLKWQAIQAAERGSGANDAVFGMKKEEAESSDGSAVKEG
jgi:hypothetical protein